jgi:hypothetical protein
MKLYYHLSRGTLFNSGDIIEKEPYYDECIITSLAPMFDAEYLSHLISMAKDGLSLHGARYLIQINNAAPNVSYPNFFMELYYEYIRWKYYPNKPSRFQSLFAWRTLKEAFDFFKRSSRGRIYEIKVANNFFVGDMNLLKLNLDPAQQEQFARDYWEGKPMSRDAGYKAAWEYVIDLPAEIVKEAVFDCTTVSEFGNGGAGITSNARK